MAESEQASIKRSLEELGNLQAEVMLDIQEVRVIQLRVKAKLEAKL